MLNFKFLEAIAFFSIFSLLSACGGGGSGSGASSGSLTYSGLTAQAVITTSNAENIAAAALSTGTSGSSLTGTVRSAATAPENSALVPAAILTAHSIAETIEQLDVTAYPATASSRAVINDSEVIPGGCGGSMAISISFDNISGNFTGSLTFNNFCEYSERVTGLATFSGVIDLNTSDFLDLSINFNNLSSVSATESYSLEGTVSFDLSALPGDMTMNMLVKNNLTSKVYRMESFNVILVDLGTEYELEMSGRFYDPDYGFVVLTTTDPLVSSYSDDYPYTGQLVLLGSTSTAARLTALSATECLVEADTDGNGSYEYSSGPLRWGNL